MSEKVRTTTGNESEEAVRRSISVQADAVARLANSETIDQITEAARLIDDSNGRVAFAGVGKSGNVAKKIVATFNSIGVTSFFVHPVEALHGGLGALNEEDIVVLISNSGNTDEMVEFLQFLNVFDPTTITITADPDSKLGSRTDLAIDTCVEAEGSVVELVPMASMTATMVVGDSIANTLMRRRNFGEQDFGYFHPGGTIGKRLLLGVEDLQTEVPRTDPTDTLAEVAIKIGQGGKGIAVVQDADRQMLGVLTDGDIRRLIESGTNFHDTLAEDVMTEDPFTISSGAPAIRALNLMEDNDITQLVVVDGRTVQGIVNIHDLVKEGLTSAA